MCCIAARRCISRKCEREPATCRWAQYLNSLTAAAHSLIYLPPKDPALKGAVLFVIEGFARTIARQWVFHAISVALLLSGAAAGVLRRDRRPVGVVRTDARR